MNRESSPHPILLIATLFTATLAPSVLAAAPLPEATAPLPVWDDCGFEPWDPVLNAPRQPEPAGSPRSCAASGYFRIACGEGPCPPLTHLPPIIHSERMEVVDGKCVQRGEFTFAYCTQIVELRLLPPACPRPATSARGGVFKTPDGVIHISGERIGISMDYDFSCGTFHCESDPQTEEDPTNPGYPLLCAPPASPCKSPCELPPLSPFDRYPTELL